MRLFLYIILAFGILNLVGCETLNPLPAVVSPINSDETITTDVQSALSNSGEFNEVKVMVLSESGMVTLSGFVKTIRQYDNAVKIASEIRGVQGVRNHLVIRK